MSINKDKKTLTNYILDYLNIKLFRNQILNILLKKLTHKDLSNIAIAIVKNSFNK